jgi:hypothetical protein
MTAIVAAGCVGFHGASTDCLMEWSHPRMNQDTELKCPRS